MNRTRKSLFSNSEKQSVAVRALIMLLLYLYIELLNN
jgi:hypothetical protein